jgi:hypothetical protein
MFKKLVITMATVFAVMFGTQVVTAPPASAGDAYGTSWHNTSGVGVWGPYNQTTSNKAWAVQAKSMLRTGTAIGAVAAAICAAAAPLVVKATCVYAATKNGAEFRDAVNDANATGKCVTFRFYAINSANVLARTVNSGYCWFPQYGSYGYYGGCPNGFCGGGGGGGGGGGSWKNASDW